jgi:rare lipoprotein A
MQDIFKLFLSGIVILAVSACSSTLTQPTGVSQAAAIAAAKAKTELRYDIKQDLGPEQHQDMSNTPDATPQVEPLSRGGNMSTYKVWGKSYSVMASSVGFQQRGLASWYGQKFHGHLTSNGETYDMYAMSAAHKSLPLPTYARITNLANNKSVIVRVNDRGPFHGDRVIDLSYAAASKLDYRKTGVAEVLVEAIDARQWSPELEKNIRKQRGGSSVSSSQSDVYSSTQSVAITTEPARILSANDIRQQSKRKADYYVQVAAVSQIGSALVLRSTLGQQLRRSDVFVEQAADRADLFRVLIGPVTDANSALALIQRLAELGRGQGLMIKP